MRLARLTLDLPSLPQKHKRELIYLQDSLQTELPLFNLNGYVYPVIQVKLERHVLFAKRRSSRSGLTRRKSGSGGMPWKSMRP